MVNCAFRGATRVSDTLLGICYPDRLWFSAMVRPRWRFLPSASSR